MGWLVLALFGALLVALQSDIGTKPSDPAALPLGIAAIALFVLFLVWLWRRFRIVAFPFLQFPIMYAWEQVRFAAAWLYFLLRERSKDRRRERIAEFIRKANALRGRGAENVGVMRKLVDQRFPRRPGSR